MILFIGALTGGEMSRWIGRAIHQAGFRSRIFQSILGIIQGDRGQLHE